MAKDQRSWVDPRTSPRPPAVAREPAADASEIAELIGLCRRGLIYGVERWIQDGKPLQVARRRPGSRRGDTPLAIAIDTKQDDLVHLLLCNGYRPDLEPDNPIERALKRRCRELLDLLAAWGGDPAAVRVREVLDTEDAGILDWFWDRGLDLTADEILAEVLAEFAIKPVCGWAKRHRDDPRVALALTVALSEVIWSDRRESRERAAHLLVWAGADPHLRVGLIRWRRRGLDDEAERNSAVETAVFRGRHELLKLLKPDPALDDFARVYSNVCDPETVDILVRIRPPADWSEAIKHNVSYMVNDVWDSRAAEHRWCLERIAHHGGCLTNLGRRDLDDMRRAILATKRKEVQRWVLDWLSNPRYCDPALFDALVKPPNLQATLRELGLRTRLEMMRAHRLPEEPTEQRRFAGRRNGRYRWHSRAADDHACRAESYFACRRLLCPGFPHTPQDCFVARRRAGRFRTNVACLTSCHRHLTGRR
jgi:hypothetical protein